MLKRCRVTFLAIMAFSSAAYAEEELPENDTLPLEIHGFASPGFIVTSENNYFGRSKRGSFEFTEIGINFTKPLTEKLRFGLQLFSRDLGILGNYNLRADWFYLDYRFKDWLSLRAGRVKLPFGLYNDTSDIDAARVPVLLPQSVYPAGNRDFLLAQTGVELYGYLDIGRAGAIDYRGYAGTIFIDNITRLTSVFKVDDIGVPYVIGGRVLWETPLDGLRAGASLQILRLDASVVFETPAPTVVTAEVPAIVWVASAEYARDDLLIAAEYSRWRTELRSSDSTLLPTRAWVESERAYVMGSYRFNDWFQPGVYYSLFYPDATKRQGRETVQQDAAATLRFDINPHWITKLEAHYMHGTAGLSSQLNDSKPLSQLSQIWTVFLVKTTAYF